MSNLNECNRQSLYEIFNFIHVTPGMDLEFSLSMSCHILRYFIIKFTFMNSVNAANIQTKIIHYLEEILV